MANNATHKANYISSLAKLGYALCGVIALVCLSVNSVQASDVSVSRLDPIDLVWSGFGQLQGSDSFCVSSSTGGYTISVNGQSPRKFEMIGAGSSLAYSVRVANMAGQSNGAELKSPVDSETFGSGASDQVGCGGAENATLTLVIDARDLAAASAGRYRDTLRVIIGAQ